MTHKDRIFVNAIRDLATLQLDDGARIDDVINTGTHTAQVRVLEPLGGSSHSNRVRYFIVKVSESQ
jgi:hypothetical protein